MDTMKLVLIIFLAATGLSFATAVYIAWENGASRNLGLSTGTLLAAIMLYVVQLGFELRTKTSVSFVGTEVTIDRTKPDIRDWKYQYHPGNTMRFGTENEAAKWLVANNASAFQADRDKLSKDFVVFSLTALVLGEFDWQARKVSLRTDSGITLTTYEPVSTPNECVIVKSEQLQQKLEAAGNAFAKAPLLGFQVCIPPQSQLAITSDSVTLQNPVYRVTLKVRFPGGTLLVHPETRMSVLLPNGESQFENRIMGVRAETEFHALRSQDRNIEKYKDWTDRLISDVHAWYEN
jgi:hypothetical protein